MFVVPLQTMHNVTVRTLYTRVVISNKILANLVLIVLWTVLLCLLQILLCFCHGCYGDMLIFSEVCCFVMIENNGK